MVQYRTNPQGAELSKVIHGPAPIKVINFRHSCCYGTTLDGVRVSQSCPSLLRLAGHDYCEACGCGDWRKARLNPKTEGDWSTS